jgi:hypothetical protein
MMIRLRKSGKSRDLQIADHRRLQIWEWQNKKQRAQDFQSAISNLKSNLRTPTLLITT